MSTSARPTLRQVVTARGSSAWSVAFDLIMLRRIVDDGDLAAMFGLTRSDVPQVAAVVLSSDGSLVLRRDTQQRHRPQALERSLVDCLDAITTDDAACVGIADAGVLGTVAMSAHVLAFHDGRGEAAFELPPDGLVAARPLLAAVGVRPLEVRQVGDLHRVDFAFDLRRHVESARLARFGRTMSCVEFFTGGVEAAGTVERGLRDAASARIRHGGDLLRQRAVSLLDSGRALTMTSRSPSRSPGGEVGRAYGDIVPEGMLLAGLRHVTGAHAAAQIAACVELRGRLLEARSVGGWAFHRGTLPTATDSALVLLGIQDRDAVRDLERYADGAGGYLPQLTRDTGDAERMVRSAGTAHWEQADLFTTCLIRYLRRQVGLATVTDTRWIRRRMASRWGSFTASPWLVDLAVALAVSEDEDAGDLRRTLRRELLAARNDDGSFGRRGERPLATAAAVVALSALGVRGRVLGESQIRLIESLDGDHDAAQIPFASTTIVSHPSADDLRRLLRGSDGLIAAQGRVLRLSVYEDTSGAVTLGLAALALSRAAEVDVDDTCLLEDLPTAPARYGRANVTEYITEDVLPRSLRAIEV